MTRVLYPALAAAVLAGGGPAAADHLDITTEGLRVEGVRVVFPNVRIDMDGYVVVHAVQDGTVVLPGSVGHVAVVAGEHADVAVDVAGLGAGSYMAMIHYETNGNGTYDFGEGMTDVDTPGMRPDGTPYMVEVTLRPM